MARPRIGLVPIPIEHDGVHYPSRKALAQHLAATLGGCPETWSGRLQRAANDVALAIAPPSRRPPHRRGEDRAPTNQAAI